MKPAETLIPWSEVRAQVATISWRAICRHTEMTVWVKCSRGGATWNLPLEVLPNLELRGPEPEGVRPMPSWEVLHAAQLAASHYVDRNRLSLREIFRQVH